MKNEKWLGAHVSISKGLTAAVQTAIKIGGNTMQFFTRNPRGGSAKELNAKDIDRAHLLMNEHNFGPLVAHAPYTYNLASLKEEVREFSIRTLLEDLGRVEMMRVPNLVFHVGTHGGQGEEKGIQLVIEGLQLIVERIPAGVTLLLEGMAGEGTELGYTFGQLQDIIAGCGNHPRLGVCLDSCHLTGAGYDLQDLEYVKGEIDKHIGLDRLKAFHLNDSMYPLGSRRDRHARLGEGKLGLEVIRNIVCDDVLGEVPLILETPNELDGYAREIELIKSFYSPVDKDKIQ